MANWFDKNPAKQKIHTKPVIHHVTKNAPVHEI